MHIEVPLFLNNNNSLKSSSQYKLQKVALVLVDIILVDLPQIFSFRVSIPCWCMPCSIKNPIEVFYMWSHDMICSGTVKRQCDATTHFIPGVLRLFFNQETDTSRGADSGPWPWWPWPWWPWPWPWWPWPWWPWPWPWRSHIMRRWTATRTNLK